MEKQIEATNPQSEKEAAAEVYRHHQEATMKAWQLVTDVRKGILAGEDVYELLLRALKALELLTGEPELAVHAEEDLIAIYGIALEKRLPLQRELANVEKRLQMLHDAEANTGVAEGESIKRAIREHEKLLATIKKKLERATE